MRKFVRKEALSIIMNLHMILGVTRDKLLQITKVPPVLRWTHALSKCMQMILITTALAHWNVGATLKNVKHFIS